MFSIIHSVFKKKSVKPAENIWLWQLFISIVSFNKVYDNNIVGLSICSWNISSVKKMSNQRNSAGGLLDKGMSSSDLQIAVLSVQLSQSIIRLQQLTSSLLQEWKVAFWKSSNYAAGPALAVESEIQG